MPPLLRRKLLAELPNGLRGWLFQKEEEEGKMEEMPCEDTREEDRQTKNSKMHTHVEFLTFCILRLRLFSFEKTCL